MNTPISQAPVSPETLDHRLKLFIVGDALSAFGDGLFFVGVSWLILSAGGSALDVGVYLALSSVAGVVLSPIYGIVVDRYSAKSLCLIADVARAAVVLLLAALAGSGSLSFPIILACGFALFAGDRLFWPASAALVRSVATDGRLAKAYSVMSLAGQAGTVMGAGLSGLIIEAWGYQWLFAIDAATFLISAWMVSLQRPGHAAPSSTPVVPWSYLAGLLQGFHHFAQSRISRLLFLQLGLVYALYYATNTLLPVFVKQSLHGTPTDFGIIDGGWALGAVACGAVLSAWPWQAAWRSLVIATVWAQACAALLFSQVDGVAQAAVTYLVLGFFFTASKTMLETQFQISMPRDVQGRARSAFSFVMSWVSLIIYLSAGYFASERSTRMAYLGVAALMLGTGVIATIHLRAIRQDAPLPQ